MIKEVTRSVRRTTERELWARAAGRCEFNGCNKLLYKSPVTQEAVNVSEMAHIYSFSEKGPRGWGPFRLSPGNLNDISSLLLVCQDCHTEIDKEEHGGRYQASLLIRWKEEHERRVAMVTGVNPKNSSYVVLYGANIGHEKSLLQPEHAKWALFPDWYPGEEHPVELSMSWEGKDDEQNYWLIEETNLVRAFERQVKPLIAEGCHFSIFAFAPIPLLIRLGTLFTDKIDAQVYQLHREPKKTWEWGNSVEDNPYLMHKPDTVSGPPALVISLSDRVARERVVSILGPNTTIWELTVREPGADFLKNTAQLSEFRIACRQLMILITDMHGIETPLALFPAMPVACAVELGRIRMPKSQMPWTIYDHNGRLGVFVPTITVGGRPYADYERVDT